MKEKYTTTKIFSCKMIIQMWKMMMSMEKAYNKSKIKQITIFKIMRIKMLLMGII